MVCAGDFHMAVLEGTYSRFSSVQFSSGRHCQTIQSKYMNNVFEDSCNK